MGKLINEEELKRRLAEEAEKESGNSNGFNVLQNIIAQGNAQKNASQFTTNPQVNNWLGFNMVTASPLRKALLEPETYPSSDGRSHGGGGRSDSEMQTSTNPLKGITFDDLKDIVAEGNGAATAVSDTTAVGQKPTSDPLEELRDRYNQVIGINKSLPKDFVIDIPGFEKEATRKIDEAEANGETLSNEDKKKILDDTLKGYIPEWTPSTKGDNTSSVEITSGGNQDSSSGGSSDGSYSDIGASSTALAWIQKQINDLNSQRTQYSDKIDALINDYLNRGRFEYDPNADMLYQNYLAAMQNAGQMAMKDTMGQAAMLTGGYGSSYATAAANGAYNSYLQKANEALPDYYNIAANAYDRQGEEMLAQMKLLQSQDEEAYKRYAEQMKLATDGSANANGSADTMTAAQENTVMSSALKTWIESNGSEAEIDKLLDGMSGYNLSDDFRQKVKDYINKHSTKITKVKDKFGKKSDVYTDGVNEYTYNELMSQFGEYFSDDQKNKIKELAEGKSYIF